MRCYIGTVIIKSDTSSVISYNGANTEQMLEMILKREYVNQEADKSFPKAFYLNLCILLIQAVLNMKLFVSDRQNDIMNRLQIMGLQKSQYLISYLFFNWAALFIPYSISNIICNIIFFGSTMIENIKILFICFIVTGLFASIAQLICSSVKDNASVIMVGNIIACFTTLLSGMFGSWNNRILKAVGNCMPQSISYRWVDKIFHQGSIINSSFLLIITLFIVILCSTLLIYNKTSKID
ncbi:ABC transporter permease [Sedimentibacter sp. zth1]|uniref:ABC transporter permease n=1 Tax=Sedimentibacter sp. zth1 TaxID=2816908 RepID=UPI001F5FE674|nr:ABC transporter permease [Sedimentibacter sp. zth1]